MPLAAGTSLGPYTILATAGTGGMGEVYRARDPRLDRDVAIKVLPEAFAGDTDRLRRFAREARAIAALNHPHICQIHDVGSGYIVLEYIDGEPVHGPLAVNNAIRFALQIASALEAAHQRGILHRDLKPSNILVTRQGAVKLLDFGLAKSIRPTVIDPEDVTSPVVATAAGAVWGSPAYMSPEQAEGKPLDARSDIFSFGIVVYEMLSGKRPFQGNTAAQVISAVLRDNPAPLEAPQALNAIVRRCLAKRPDERFQTVGELRTVLEYVAGDPPTELATHEPSIAVLPFANMSPDKENEYFCDGLAEDIINVLAQIAGLKVAGRTSSFFFRDKGIEFQEIGRRLNVEHLLDGSVRRAGHRVRVTVQLIKAFDGFHVWSERYDRQMDDIFVIQDEITHAVAAALRLKLQLVEQATTNVDAYQLYLKGRSLLGRRGTSIPVALELFRKAVQLDPAYSLAWSGVADALTGLAITGSIAGMESKSDAIVAATRSIQLDPSSAAGHSALACAALLFENNRATAKAEFERALDLNPGYALGRCWYGLFYRQWACGQLEEGVAETRRALETDPLSSYLTFIHGTCLYTAGRLKEATEHARRAIQHDPQSFVAHWLLGLLFAETGRFAEAITTLEAAAGMSGRHVRALSTLATVFGLANDRDKANRVHHELMDRASQTYVPQTYLALTAEAAGRREEALAFVQRAWDEREPTFLLHARYFPEFASLRAHQPFLDILHEMDA